MASRKDYCAIAEIVYKNQRLDHIDSLRTSSVIDDLINYFAKDNPRFNQYKFRKACLGIGGE